MKIGKLKLSLLAILLLAGLHLYNQYRLGTITSANDYSLLFYDKQNPPVIVAFGDSLTYGTGARSGGVDMSYPAQLSRLLGIHVINEGIPGEMAQNGYERFIKVLQTYKPDIVILCEGGNDLLRKRDQEEIKRDLEKMVDAATESGVSVVLLGVPEPYGILFTDAEIYREIAEETGVTYLPNLFGEILSNDSLKHDPIHPNREGYAIIAQKIYESLRGDR